MTCLFIFSPNLPNFHKTWSFRGDKAEKLAIFACIQFLYNTASQMYLKFNFT